MKAALIATLLGAYALYLPRVYGTGSCASGTFTDTFEDQKAANVLTPEVNAPVQVPYHGLKYSMVNVNSLTAGNLDVKSPSNVAALFIVNDVLSGNLATNPYFTISALPGTAGSAKTFDLIDFYFGCVLPAGQSGVNVASACDIAVTGVKPDGTQSGELTFSFASTVVTAQNQMARANVVAQALTGDYVGLASVNITITRAAVAAAAGVLVVDNVRHVNHC